MKILLTADWHVGVRGDSETYHKIFSDWIEKFLIPTIKTEKISKLYILGDFFDNRSAVNVNSENIAIWALDKIQTYCDTTMIIGNHDMYFKNKRDVNSLKKFDSFVDVIEYPKFKNIGKREIALIPWIIDENEMNEVCKIKSDICLGHFPFNGFKMSSGMVETKGFSFDKLKDNYLKVFSGHFHLRNETYVGNPFQMSWADTEDEKGLTILDTETLSTKFIPNTISPIYKKVYLSQLKNKTISIDVTKGNFIRVFLDDKYSDKTLEKLQEVIGTKCPLSFTFDGLADDDINTDITVNDLTNPIEGLIQWLNKIDLKKGVDRDTLIKKVSSLYTNSI